MHKPKNSLFKRIRASFLAFVVVIAVALFAITPAVMAQIPVGQDFSERRIRSGAASPSANISNSGSNVNLCPTVQQLTNTGNVANEQGVSQYNPQGGGISGYSSRFFGSNPFDNGFFGSNPFDNGDIDFEGSSINVDGSASSECNQTINQGAAAAPSPGVVATVGGGGAPVAAAGGAVAGAPGGGGGGAPGGGGGGAPGGGGGGGGPAAKAGGGMLPSTGGAPVAPVLALGAGVLLVGGGLLAYRRFIS